MSAQMGSPEELLGLGESALAQSRWQDAADLLGMALELERRAEDFFRTWAATSTGAVADLYRELAAEEVEHIDLLISELTALRESRAGLL